MNIKDSNETGNKIEEHEQIQIQENHIASEEFEKWLRDKNIHLTPKEIADDCQGILDMLNE